jgi:hypothetical protein
VKRRGWKIVLGLLLAIAAGIGGLYWELQRRATAVFDRHDRGAREAIAAIRARPGSRPVLFEPAVSGDAWPLYVKALKGFAAIPDPEADQLPSLNGDPDFREDPEALEAIFAKHAPLVADLRDSNARSEFVPAYSYEDSFSMDLWNISPAIRAAKFLSDRATFAHGKVDGRTALESVLLGLALGHDTARGGVIVNDLVMIVCEGIETEALRQMLAGHSFEAADLQWFAGRLDRLWAARPTLAEMFHNEGVFCRRFLVDLGDHGASPAAAFGPLEYRSWRYLFSLRLAAAGALGEMESAYREVDGIASLAPHLRGDAFDQIAQKAMKSKNPIVDQILPSLGRVYVRDAHAMMNWTLMRVAVAIAWVESERGVVPETLQELVPRYLSSVPSCPRTGKPLGYRDGRVWSAGVNGVDDGGVPGRTDDSDDPDGDVVWTVRRE